MLAPPIVLALIAAYFVLTTSVGVVMARRSRGGDDWAIAGRRMGLGLMAFGIMATRVGGISTYGVAGDVITGGVWNLWYAASAVVAMAVMGCFFARAYRRLGLQTVGEIFQRRFGSRRCQTVASLCVQTEFVVVNILEPYIIGQILATLTGLPFGATVACAALWLISYTAIGGLWGSAASNALHTMTIFGGLAAVSVTGLVHLGGWGNMVLTLEATLADAGMDAARWWHPAGAGWVAVFGMVLAAVLHTPAVSIWVNFSSAARDEKSVVPAFVVGGFMAGLGSLLAGLIGMETLAHYGARAQLSSYESITRLAVDLNPWVGGLALAAVLAAVVSSGGPILLASATMLVRDWIPSSASWTERRRLGAYRATTVVYGAAAAAAAWLAPIASVLDLLLFAFAMVVPPAIAVAFVLYWKPTTEGGVFWGIVSGYGAGLLWYGLTHVANAAGLSLPGDAGWTQQLTYSLLVDGGGVDPSYPATLVTLLAIPVLSRLTPDDTSYWLSFRRALESQP